MPSRLVVFPAHVCLKTLATRSTEKSTVSENQFQFSLAPASIKPLIKTVPFVGDAMSSVQLAVSCYLAGYLDHVWHHEDYVVLLNCPEVDDPMRHREYSNS